MTLRLWLLAGAVASAFGMWLYVSGLQSKNAELVGENRALNSAVQMRTIENAVTETFHHDTKIIRETVEKEADAVEAIPSDKLPDDVLSAWRRGLSNVAANAVDHDTDQPSGTLH